MRRIVCILVTGFFLFVPLLNAQPVRNVSPVSIGSKVPDALWKLILRAKTTKLIILDFWNIWCPGCMYAFPKLDSLQKKFEKEIKIVLITKNTAAEVKKMFSPPSRFGNKKFPVLTSFTNDQYFSKAFPYEIIPHHVWIDGKGIVRAFTNGETTTANHIQKYLEGKEVKWSQKMDIPGFDYEKPLFMGDQLDIHQVMHYSLLTKGRVGLGTRSGWRKDDTYGTVNIVQTNSRLLNLYEWAIRRAWLLYKPNRFVVEVKDSSGLIFDSSKTDLESWRESNLYCYNLVVPLAEGSHIFRYMLDDLNRYTPYHGRIEKRKVNCLILVRTSADNKIKSKGGTPAHELHQKGNFFLNNSPLDLLMFKLNYSYSLPVIDETEYKETVDLILHSNLDNLTELRIELQKFDLNLVEAVREIDMFVLSQK